MTRSDPQPEPFVGRARVTRGLFFARWIWKYLFESYAIWFDLMEMSWLAEMPQLPLWRNTEAAEFASVKIANLASLLEFLSYCE